MKPSWKMVVPGFLCACVSLLLLHAPAMAKDPALDIGTARDIWDGSLYPDKAVRTYQNTDKIFPTRTIKAGKKASPLAASATPLTALSFTSANKTYDLPDYVALNRLVGLIVLKDGQIAYEHYDYGFKADKRWMSMSLAKSLVSTLVGAAVKDGFIASIDDPVTRYLPQLAGSGYEGVSVKNILMMASGVKWDETYVNPASDRRKLLELQIASNQRGAIFDLMKTLPKAAEPGTTFNYSTGETVLIGEVVQAATKMHLADYLSKKIWIPVGMEADASWYLDAPGGHEVGGSGGPGPAAGLRPLRPVHPGRGQGERPAHRARHLAGRGHQGPDSFPLPLPALRLPVVGGEGRSRHGARRGLHGPGHPRPVHVHQSQGEGGGHRTQRPAQAHGQGRRLGPGLPGRCGEEAGREVSRS